MNGARIRAEHKSRLPRAGAEHRQPPPPCNSVRARVCVHVHRPCGGGEYARARALVVRGAPLCPFRRCRLCILTEFLWPGFVLNAMHSGTLLRPRSARASLFGEGNKQPLARSVGKCIQKFANWPFAAVRRQSRQRHGSSVCGFPMLRRKISIVAGSIGERLENAPCACVAIVNGRLRRTAACSRLRCLENAFAVAPRSSGARVVALTTWGGRVFVLSPKTRLSVSL